MSACSSDPASEPGAPVTTVLVTGATGFVGSHALEALALRSRLSVIAACRDPGRLPSDFAGDIRVGDLRDAAYRARLLDGVDVVCHCMSWTTLFGDDHRSRDLYLEPTLDLLEAVVARGIKRFVNVSTTSAAAPERSANPMSRGIPRSFWPHLSSVVAIENAMRERADRQTCMVNLRFGIFAGRRYGLGVLPILVPRLRTHLVPWVAGGRTSLPITAGEDIGEALALAATAPDLAGYEGFNVVGPEVPCVRQVIEFLHQEYALPLPHFSVPFAVAYPFAWLMEKIDPLVSWDPLVTRSIIHLLEEVAADNERAERRLGYRPKVAWRDAIREQMAEMWARQGKPMRMSKALPSAP
jgi:nucleoside-diphosphate-sugar epimerase